MGINADTFRPGANRTTQTTTGSTKELKKAKIWLNIGYKVEHPPEGAENMDFVSLPLGIPLDTQEPVPTNSSNMVYAEFQSARNNLLESLLEHARKLSPGESCSVDLTVQLRHVKEENAVITAESNRFVKKLAF